MFTRRLAEINLPPELVGASRLKIQPIVLTHAEVLAVINKIHGTPRLMTKILYGSGLLLRISDIVPQWLLDCGLYLNTG